MTEIGKVREEIAELIYTQNKSPFSPTWADLNYMVKAPYLKDADQVLALIVEWGNEVCPHQTFTGYVPEVHLHSYKKRECSTCWLKLTEEVKDGG